MSYVSNTPEEIKRDVTALAADLDAATLALADYVPSAHDEIDELGSLWHNPNGCPHCRFNRARSAFRATLRADVLDRNKALEAWVATPAFNAGQAVLKARVAHLRTRRAKARAHYDDINNDLEASPREVTEAAIALEGAELDYETIYVGWLHTINDELIVQEQVAACQRQKAGDPYACSDMAQIALALREWLLNQPLHKEYYLEGKHKFVEWCEWQFNRMTEGVS